MSLDGRGLRLQQVLGDQQKKMVRTRRSSSTGGWTIMECPEGA